MTAKDLQAITLVCVDEPDLLPMMLAFQRVVDARKAFNQKLKEILCLNPMQN